MILYQLRCGDEHVFEAWFRDSDAYDVQVDAGHVECPYCGSVKIEKALMAPHVARGTVAKSDEGTSERDQDQADGAVRAHEVAQQILDAVGKIREYADENFDDVGDEFATEARKIHHGDAPERGIYGQASEDEAHDLEDEGIDIVRLPGTPRRND